VGSLVSRVEKIYDEHFPGNSFNYFFADRNFDRLFRAERRLLRLVGVFSAFAVLVAALGLLGLAAQTTSQRRKEISVRKVLGASGASIARMLTGGFAALVGLALLPSVPLTWIVADRWLNGFADRITLSPLHFVLPAVLVLVIAFGTSAFHVIRVSTMNPVDGIRGE
jgi:putative ABC transport system permease protein